MRKKAELLFAIIFPIFLSSCQKELSGEIDPPGSPDSTVNTTSSRIKTYTEDVTSSGSHTVITFDVGYDAGNRVVSLISETTPGDKFIYQYSGSSYTLDIYNSNAISIHELFFLNSNSLVDSTIQYDDTKDTSTEKYIYNSAKQLITLKEYDYSILTGSVLFNTQQYEYDNGGNVTKLTEDNSTTTYEYYPDLLNTLNIAAPYLPVNKNLVKTTTVDFGGGEIETLNHTYTFDTSKRITSEKITDNNGGIVIRSYTYY